MFLPLYKSEIGRVKDGTFSLFLLFFFLLELQREGSHVFFYDVLCRNGERERTREETRKMFCCIVDVLVCSL